MTGRSHPTRTALTALAVSATTALATLTYAPPAQAQLPAGYQSEAFAATNAQRVLHSRAPLAPGACVQKWAVRQARKMANQQRMVHQDVQRVAEDCRLSYAGENVAYGYPSGRSVVRAWMGSEGHRANILSRRYRQMGIGARKSDGVWYVAQVFGRKAR